MAKNIRVVGLWFALIFCLILLSFSVKTIKEIRNSFVANLSRVSMAFLSGNKMVIYSFEGNKGIVFSADYHGETNLTAVNDFVLQNYFFPVFGYFSGFNPKFVKNNDQAGMFRKVILSSLLNKSKTSFSRPDLIILLFNSLFIKNDIITYENFSDIPQGSFKDGKLRNEGLSVSVLNATSVTGLALKTGLILENSGMRVIQISDNQEEKEKCEITFSRKGEKSYSAFWLENVYHCQVKSGYDENGRVDLTLILGKDFLKN